jgi:glucose-1-phosphate cytidylyltransferase
MKLYSFHGINDFIICLGFKGYIIKEYFLNYCFHQSDITLDLGKNSVKMHAAPAENWRVTLVDTGQDTMTGGRLKRTAEYLDEDTFCMTYGDGVGDMDIADSIRFHQAHGLAATVTATQPPGRFGSLRLAACEEVVEGFQEKPIGDGGWINGGFFVLSRSVLDMIEGDDTVWEAGPLEQLAASKQLAAYKHKGFWRPMDTLRDKNHLEHLWQSGQAPWKVW